MAQGGTITKRIRLKVDSSGPNLSGITQALRAVDRLNAGLIVLGDELASNRNSFSAFVRNADISGQRAAAAIERSAARMREALASVSNVNPFAGMQLPQGRRRERSARGGESGRTPIQRGLLGFTPAGYVANTLTAGSWMAAYAGIEKGTELVSNSVRRMMELQVQTAVLRQTFRGVGGSAVQLADDVLKLAAAEGRGTDEAMKAATHWTRLGLSRQQAAEATRVSLIAANVAEMTAHEATEKLSSVMASYNLQASELSGTLGMLARTSQTYRVTTGELLNGLSRVSNVSRAANMSLAETQGLLGAMVQKTGLSGTQVANSLQIFLSRLNQPSVQEFFERRYKTHLTGRGEDFGKIFNIYKSVGELEQREIAMRVGTGRQQNVFTAMMGVFPEAFEAARSSLLNLNAAEEENLKITSTMHAAWQRLGASWDRVINQPGVDSAFAGVLNRGAGALAGISNLIGTSAAPKPVYYDPSKANFKGTLAALFSSAMPWQFDALDAGLAGGRFAKWRDRNLGFSSEPMTEADIFSRNMRGIIQHRSAAEAYGEGRKLAKLKGDAGTEASEKAKQREELTIAQRLTAAETSRLNAALKTTKTEDEKLQLSRQLMEVKRETNAIDYDSLETIDRTALRTKELIQIMTAQRMLADDIASTLRGIGLPQWVESSAATTGQLNATRAMIAAAEKSGLGEDGELYQQTLDALRKEALNLEMRQNYQRSPVGLSYVRDESFKTTAARMTGLEVEGHGAGLTEGERAMDRRRWIQQEMKKYNDTSKMDQADLARAAVLLNSLKETEFAIQGRILNIERERKQVLIESQREFQRSLITAGPGEILRKLAMNSVTRGGRMGAGQFFSMSPEMRGDAYTLMGGDRMAQLNWEKKALAGQKAGTTNMQNRIWSGEQQGEKIATALVNRLGESANNAATSLNKVSVSAQALASALAIVARSAGQIGSGRSASAAAAPGAQPVPQADSTPAPPRPQAQPVPLTHGATMMDFSDKRGWAPTPNQINAMTPESQEKWHHWVESGGFIRGEPFY